VKAVNGSPLKGFNAKSKKSTEDSVLITLQYILKLSF